ncbi:hypothetical protein [Dyadobacter psychrotolerans]|uniref:Uncharacterized protein n=1 Tax=Dyadobacter psychrotolerans TaxID=2541721 RepID=A0A4R5DS66_9BACT|nr:hypothetical protein [Dyadobacter psychrotolerans]TDE15184.1 hypothetical protein E0F88_11705 [Dyadobacter psychrotolerans]
MILTKRNLLKAEKFPFFFMTILSIMLFFSCEETGKVRGDEDYIVKLDTYVKFKANGKQYYLKQESNIVNVYTIISSRPVPDFYKFQITGLVASDGFPALTLVAASTKYFEEGEYKSDDINNLNPRISISARLPISGDAKKFDTYSGDKNLTFKISKHFNERVEGTFSGTLYSETDNSKILITEGSFSAIRSI